MKGIFLATLGLALGLGACGFGSQDPIEPPPGPALTVRPAALTLAVGATDTLFAVVTGVAANADRTINWSVGDTTVVRLTSLSPPDYAAVVGRKAGSTGVTATWRADPTVRASSEVTVR